MKNRYSFTNYVQIRKWTDSTFALPFWRIKNLPYIHSPYTTIDNLLLFFKNIYQYHPQEKIHVTWIKNCYLFCVFDCLYVCRSLQISFLHISWKVHIFTSSFATLYESFWLNFCEIKKKSWFTKKFRTTFFLDKFSIFQGRYLLYIGDLLSCW